jgi:hypothetical protein
MKTTSTPGPDYAKTACGTDADCSGQTPPTCTATDGQSTGLTIFQWVAQLNGGAGFEGHHPATASKRSLSLTPRRRHTGAPGTIFPPIPVGYIPPNPVNVAVERQTVEQFLTDWLEHSVKPSVRVLTFELYRQHVKSYLAPMLGHHRLAKLEPQHVRAFLKHQLDTGLAP